MDPNLEPKPVTSTTTLVRPPEDKKPNWPLFAGGAALVILVALAAFGLGQLTAHKSDTTANPSASASASTAAKAIALATPTPTPTATPVPDPYAGWSTYTSTTEPALSFRYPSDWTLATQSNPTGSDPNVKFSSYDTATLTNAKGSRIQYFAYVSGIGGACTDDSTETVVYLGDTLTSDLKVIAYRNSAAGREHYGVVSTDQSKTTHTRPVGTVINYCYEYTLFYGRGDGRQMWFQETNVTDGDLDTVKKILGSIKYN